MMIQNMNMSARVMLRGVVAASGLALCSGVAMAQSASLAPTPPTPPIPPTTPAIPNPPVAALAPEEGVTKSSSWTITRTENGRAVTLEGRDNQITAQIDGKAVPAERIERDGQMVRIKDDNGAVIFEQMVIEPMTVTIMGSGSGARPGARAFAGTLGQPGARAWAIAPAAPGSGGSPFYATGEQVEQPKVMIGVELAEPDASLRGHFGWKEGEMTLVSGVYQGLPAHGAGLEPYDVIVSIDGKSPAPPDVVRSALRAKDAGQSVRMDVLHKGEKKSVTLTLEAYDRTKMYSAKVDRIASASSGGTQDIFETLAATPVAPGQAWTLNGRGGPIVGTLPGAGGKSRNQVFWKIDDNAAQHEELAKQAEEIARHADEMAKQWGQPGGAAEMNRRMEERMKKMEEMLRQMMERQNPTSPLPSVPKPGAPDTKNEKQSWRPIVRATMS